MEIWGGEDEGARTLQMFVRRVNCVHKTSPALFTLCVKCSNLILLTLPIRLCVRAYVVRQFSCYNSNTFFTLKIKMIHFMSS